MYTGTDGYLEIDIGTAFGLINFYVHAFTPGGAGANVQFYANVVNSGCTYTLGSTTSQDFYKDPASDLPIDYASATY